MLACKEEAGTLQRGVTIIIRPTPTEIADAIWNLSDKEQIVLLGCLKRRFCNRGEGLLQIAAVANELDKVPEEKVKEVKDFVAVLADYILGGRNVPERPFTKDELRNKAREFVCQLASGTPAEIEYYANILVEFAQGVIKELEERNGLKLKED